MSDKISKIPEFSITNLEATNAARVMVDDLNTEYNIIIRELDYMLAKALRELYEED